MASLITSVCFENSGSRRACPPKEGFSLRLYVPSLRSFAFLRAFALKLFSSFWVPPSGMNGSVPSVSPWLFAVRS